MATMQQSAAGPSPRVPDSPSGAGSRGALGALSRLVLRHPRAVAGAWLVLFLVSAALASQIDSRLQDGGYGAPGSQSDTAAAVGAAKFAPDSTPQAYLSVVASSSSATTADVTRDATVAAQAVARVGQVKAVGTPVVSPDGRAALLPVSLHGSLPRAQAHVPAVEAALARVKTPSTKVALIGQAPIYAHYVEQSKKSLQTSSVISFPVTVAILLVAFLSVVAALLPVGLAAVSIGVTLGALYLISYVVTLNAFVLDAVLVLGLGLSIDFSLFIVTRVREEQRRHGLTLEESIATALTTTGRAITISGLTIAVALAGLFITGIEIFSSLALGAIGAALIAIAAALTLTPAVLALLGDRLERFPIRRAVARAENAAVWTRLADFVARRRVAVVACVIPLLLALSLPLTAMQIDFATVGALPAGDEVRDASDRTAQHFGPGFGSPTRVLARAPGDQLAAAVARQPGVVAVSAPERGADGWARVSATLAVVPDSERARDTVRHMRRALPAAIGVEPLVGGLTAEATDVLDRVTARTPLVVLVVLLAEILLLTMVFSAPLLALKAAITTLLSVTAAIGAMMLLFGGSDAIQYQVPLFLFATVFGLSTDYEVLLLSRIREAHLRGEANVDAVKSGLVLTARSITLAGMVMMVVFFSFAVSPLETLQQLGVGLGLAILLDVTVVRGLLVPAAMSLLGKWNWWRPTLPGLRSARRARA
jgi:RND superfamily putative drug exporter